MYALIDSLLYESALKAQKINQKENETNQNKMNNCWFLLILMKSGPILVTFSWQNQEIFRLISFEQTIQTAYVNSIKCIKRVLL